MKDKIWTEYELEERDRIAATDARMIASSKHPRDWVKILMPELLKYEILPDIVWDEMSDDEIREFAKSKISPPGRLSKAPDFTHHNKKPLIPVADLVMLAIDVELKTPIRTQAEEDKYRRILDLALSYGLTKKNPFAGWHGGTLGSYQIGPKKFIKWLKLMGEDPPTEWKPTVQSVPKDWLHVEEVSRQRAKISGALDEKPIWILRQIPGGQWECGNESAPVRIKNLMGLADMAYAINSTGKEINPFDLPGSSGAVADIDNLRVSLFEGPDSGITESHGLHFGADDTAPPNDRRQYSEKIRELEDDIQAAEETGNDDEQAEKEAELAELRIHMTEMTSPGGKPKKLDFGNPTIKAGHNASGRKNTALGKLREAGLSDMAAHLDEFYNTGLKVIIYTSGRPFPDWILK